MQTSRPRAACRRVRDRGSRVNRRLEEFRGDRWLQFADWPQHRKLPSTAQQAYSSRLTMTVFCLMQEFRQKSRQAAEHAAEHKS